MNKYLFVFLSLILSVFLTSCGYIGPGMGPGTQPGNPPSNMPHDPDIMDDNMPDDVSKDYPEFDTDYEEDDHTDGHEEVAPPPADLTFSKERAENTFLQNCARCHGANLEGGGPVPSLQKVGRTHTKDDILTVIRTGPNIMPANLVTGEEAENLAKWLWTKR